MRPWASLVLAVLALSPVLTLAQSWGFEDATLTVQGKGEGVGGGRKETLSPRSALPTAVPLPASDVLKIVLTAKEGKMAKRPHQAFLTLQEQDTNLEESFAFTLKESGKGKVEVTQKDLPYQFLNTNKAVKASLVLASFGSPQPFKQHVFDLIVQTDPNMPPAVPPAPERYAAKPEIHHVFKQDPRSPPKAISLLFTLAILVTLPALVGAWMFIDGNLDHLGRAFGASPVSHGVFLASILAMEGAFFMYYVGWTLFTLLPVALTIGAVAYVSGSKALTEVQDRRMAGER